MVKTKRISKKLVAVVTVSVFLLTGAAVYYQNRGAPSNYQEKLEINSEQREGLNLAPPTAEDEQRANENKQNIVDRQNQPDQQSAAVKQITPVITYAGQYDALVEVGGYVPGVFEDSGTCTATFTKNGSTVEKIVTAIKNVNSVDCPVMSANSNEFNQKGNWTLTLTYKSLSASGTSSAQQIEVR